MVRFRKLAPEEVAGVQARRGRNVDISEYVEALRDLRPGEMGEAQITDGEKKSTVKRRLTTAAHRLGKEIRYRRSGENVVIYEIPEKKPTEPGPA